MDNALIGPDLSQGSSKVGMGRPLVLCLWLVFLLLSVNALLFLLTTTSPYARADVWRHLDEIIIPFLSGSSDWTVLWSNHHPSPLLHILQIVNLKLRGFRLHFDVLLGFFLLVPLGSKNHLGTFQSITEAGFFDNELSLFDEVIDLVGDKYVYAPDYKKMFMSSIDRMIMDIADKNISLKNVLFCFLNRRVKGFFCNICLGIRKIGVGSVSFFYRVF